VPAGAIKLWRMGLEKIEPYSPVYLGVELAFFSAAVKRNLDELETVQKTGMDSPDLAAPTLCRVI
jgi:hypothetical protein